MRCCVLTVRWFRLSMADGESVRKDGVNSFRYYAGGYDSFAVPPLTAVYYSSSPFVAITFLYQ